MDHSTYTILHLSTVRTSQTTQVNSLVEIKIGYNTRTNIRRLPQKNRLPITNTAALCNRTNPMSREPRLGMIRMKPMITINTEHHEAADNVVF